MMTHNFDLKNDYFRWMCDQIHITYYDERIEVIEKLYKIPFVYKNPLDDNRYDDGMMLPYRFADEFGYSRETAHDILFKQDCSVLEVILALAIRCEDTFTYDINYGDRSYVWFWEMVNSLGVIGSDDVEGIVEKWMNLEYSPDGKGSIFYIPNINKDLRNVDIWTQLCWWLDYRQI